ncbi:hypothetical protein G6L16_014560 [Agrobacterium tumefaciens]|uniref:hypothetical protein n=1 Tax=Agrobacterium tumefaciens TaxID=358 RepID=UPI0013AF9ADE|nr:hypothetical protein [Agrobacterium tumefaciens]NSZ65963.1 hypothetical protein [Agrobacterium tumefaciens]NTA72334.1 hypothetical protein [Agrobacterium tumefaciens]WIE39474.1 hypothetical protein G6L16_014560 [Agrobacterium tumefaciens]
MTDHTSHLALKLGRAMNRLSQFVYENCLPKPAIRQEPWHERRSPKSVIVFGRHPNPTTDYYFSGRFAYLQDLNFQLADIRSKDLRHLEPESALVIFCRYASASAIRWVEENEKELSGVVLFLDDDIPAVVTGHDASLQYRIFLCYRALLLLPRLRRFLDAVWVSTQRLGESLGGVEFEVMPPAPHPKFWCVDRREPSSRDNVLIAYHATGVHYSEHRFLQPVIAETLKNRPNVHFEVFADRRASKVWVGMDRVTVRRPIGWADYLAESNERQIDIMLVPLCDSEVNACRAQTKRIDVVRHGAAAIFSRSHAYGTSSASGEIILKNDQSLWIENIDVLVGDRLKRASTAEATRNIVQSMAEEGVRRRTSCEPWLSGDNTRSST